MVKLPNGMRIESVRTRDARRDGQIGHGTAGARGGNGRRDENPHDVPRDADEAARVLFGMADGHSGAAPTAMLVEHVLAVTEGGDWPVRRAAMEAVLRRAGFCLRDELKVATRPAGGAPFGDYTTRRRRRPLRPYRTRLRRLSPLRASCNCNDFLRNSLGLCKHVFAVLADVRRRKRVWKRAQTASAPVSNQFTVSWDPVRPLDGPADWLGRVSWSGRLDGPHSAFFARRTVTSRSSWQTDGAEHLLDAPGTDRLAMRTQLVQRLIETVEADAPPDPALHTLLLREKKRLAERTSTDLTNRALTRRLRSLRQPLYPYQLEGVRRFLAAGSLLLGDDMGLGKTAQAIAACHLLHREGRVRRGLLIVPASLKPQWLREWKLFSDVPVEVVDGSPDERAALYARTTDGFLVANYAQVLRDLHLMHDWDPEIVVLDEAQRIKNWATKTASYVKQLRPRHRLILTGTPMENRLDELVSLMEWVDDMALEPKWRLVPWHTQFVDGTRRISGARNLDTLRSRLAGGFLRRVRRDVLRQLPERTDTTVPVAMTTEQKGEHDELKQPIMRILQVAKRRPLRPQQFLRLMSLFTTQRILANGMAQANFTDVWPTLRSGDPANPSLRAGLGAPKLDEFRELVRHVVVDQGRKLVAFSQWRRMLKLAHWVIGDVLAEHGLRAVFFTGGEGQKRRTHNLVDFHDDPDTRVLFASDAGGVGLNLQRAASCCINLELPWNPAVLEQRIGRVHRLGQSDPVDVYALVSQNSIESRIEGIVGDKRAFFDGLFDGDSNELEFENSGSFLSRLERVTEPVEVPVLDGGTTDAGATEASDLEDERLDTRVAGAIDDTLDPEPETADARSDRQATTPSTAAASVPDAEDGTGQDRLPGATRSAGSGPLPDAAVVQGLFSRLTIHPTADGGVRIDAPKETATTLAAVFEGLAGMLRAAHDPDPVRE